MHNHHQHQHQHHLPGLFSHPRSKSSCISASTSGCRHHRLDDAPALLPRTACPPVATNPACSTASCCGRDGATANLQQLPKRRDDAWDGEEKEDRGRDKHSGQAVDQDRGNASGEIIWRQCIAGSFVAMFSHSYTGDGLAASGEDWREGGDLWKF